MPPKGKTRRKPDPDWSWVGCEVHSPEQITSEHRRRAAGLIGGSSCPYRLQTGQANSEDSVKVTKDSTCKVNTCREWHRCYNHLGADQVSPVSRE